MASSRRRLSTRVVKSTFQECFEYDIPGRNAEPKRASVPSARNRTSISNGKQEPTPKVFKVSDRSAQNSKAKVAVKKEKPKHEALKVKDKDYKPVKKYGKIQKIQNTIATRMKAKSAFIESGYKRFKVPQTKDKEVSEVAMIKKKTQREDKDVKSVADEPKKNVKSISDEPRSSLSTQLNLGSMNWQPVVHLQKISVTEPKSLESHGKDEVASSKLVRNLRKRLSSSKSSDLATRLKNALKDPMAEKEDNEFGSSDNEISNSMLVDEVLADTESERPQSGPSQQKRLASEDTVCAKRNVKIPFPSALEGVFQDNRLHKQPGSDSALEDWPESSSEDSDDVDPESKEENFSLDDFASSSSITDWAAPHVNLILLWQKQFNCVTNELRDSFQSLKSIIVEKNSLIAALKNKLDSFNDNTCHKILDSILLDYDKHDPKNPATVIVNSILEYSNSRC